MGRPQPGLFFWRLKLGFRKLKWSPHFLMYQGGCGESSAWESGLLEAGIELSLKINGVLPFQCIREAVGSPQPGNLFFWRMELSFR